MSRLAGRVDSQNGLVLHGVMVKFRRDSSVVEVPLEKQEVPYPHQTPKLEALVLGREIPTSSGYENQLELSKDETEVCCRTRHPVKGPKHRLTHS